MPKGASVTVARPGGGKATGRFQIAYAQFFTGNLVNLAIKRSGFQQLFNSSLTKAMRVPPDVRKVKYSFNANTLNMQAESAVSAAFGGVV
jgi:lipopolysaccharide assembly outer membrane protein LptD (OstA)